MRRNVLLGYQWVTGLSDTLTGMLLYVAPALTLRMMGVHAPADAGPWVGYIGAFVLSVGLAGLYGVYLVAVRARVERMETLWLLTGFSRACVAVYVMRGVLAGDFEAAWLGVALFDAACVAVQGVGLRRKWLADAA